MQLEQAVKRMRFHSRHPDDYSFLPRWPRAALLLLWSAFFLSPVVVDDVIAATVRTKFYGIRKRLGVVQGGV